MRMCMDHWNALRKAIDDKGLSGLVARSGEEAHAAMVREIKGEATKADFDPLMNANWAIVGQYINDVGIAGMMGEKCPLCEVEKSGAGRAQNWIDGSTQDQLDQARELGLVPAAQ